MKITIIHEVVAVLTVLLTVSCEELGGRNSCVTSTVSSRSHHAGRNCMDCHERGSEGAGWFTVAGTVYDSVGENIYTNATVYLCSAPNENGVILHEIPVDANGNCYTTDDVNYTNGVYAAVKGKKSTVYMAGKITDGECNRCHGKTDARIWAK